MKKLWKRVDGYVQTRQDENNQLYDEDVALTPAMKKEARITGLYGLVLGVICAGLVYYFRIEGRGLGVYIWPLVLAIICIPFGLYQTINGKPYGRK